MRYRADTSRYIPFEKLRLPAKKLPTAKQSCTGLNRLPERSLVAALTLRAQTPLVFVILPMTTDTGGRGFHLLLHTLAVTGVAIEPFMASVQLE